MKEGDRGDNQIEAVTAGMKEVMKQGLASHRSGTLHKLSQACTSRDSPF
jgi:hypothetical protein